MGSKIPVDCEFEGTWIMQAQRKSGSVKLHCGVA